MKPSPAPTNLSNQAPKSFEKPKRRQIVDGCEDEQREKEGQASAKGPILRPYADGTPPDRLRGIKNKVSTIEHRNWQEIDEPQIYGEECNQLDEFKRPEAGLLTGDLRPR